MAGLSVILESHSKLPKYPQILSKTSLILTPKMSKSFSPNSHYAPFLERCFLCNRKLLVGKDIYMYRGDRAFCSEECRSKQIFKDEESVSARDSCSLAAAEAQRCLKSLQLSSA